MGASGNAEGWAGGSGAEAGEGEMVGSYQIADGPVLGRLGQRSLLPEWVGSQGPEFSLS